MTTELRDERSVSPYRWRHHHPMQQRDGSRARTRNNSRGGIAHMAVIEWRRWCCRQTDLAQWRRHGGRRHRADQHGALMQRNFDAGRRSGLTCPTEIKAANRWWPSPCANGTARRLQYVAVDDFFRPPSSAASAKHADAWNNAVHLRRKCPCGPQLDGSRAGGAHRSRHRSPSVKTAS